LNKHAACQELISRLLDHDITLTEEEKKLLQSHLSECEECSLMYKAFSEMSDFVGGELEEPPEELRENIMAEIRREEIRRRNQRVFRWTGFVAAAAVLTLVISLAPRIISKTPGGDTTAMAGGALYAAAVEETAPVLRAYESSADQGDSPLEGLAPNDVEGTEFEDPNVTWEGDYIEYTPEGEESGSGLDPYFDEAAEEKMSMDSLLLQLSGVETSLDFSSLSLNPIYLIDTDVGVLQIYRYKNSLYFTDPFTGIPCEATCSEASLIRFLQE